MALINNSSLDDTLADAAAQQRLTLQKMDIAARAEMTFQLSDNLRSITLAGIKQRYPDYTPEQLGRAWLGMIANPAMVEQAYSVHRAVL